MASVEPSVVSGINHYQLLRLPRDAPPDIVRQAYVRLVKHIHPDLAGTDPLAAARLHNLQIAYRCLSDPEARLRYDRVLDESNAAHIDRVRRIERRLAHRRRVVRGSSSSARPVGSSTRSRRWRIGGLMLIGIAICVKLKAGGSLDF